MNCESHGKRVPQAGDFSQMLREDMVRQGGWLFQWRSYIPLLLFPLIVYGFMGYRFPFGSQKMDVILEIICFAIAFTGLGIRVLVAGYVPAGTSGRNTRHQKAARLNTTGMYSLCRNPLYLGNYLIGFGVLLFQQSLLVLIAYTIFFILYYERIILHEEEYLHKKFGKAYTDWAEHTPVIIPSFSKWKRPELPFRWRAVLRKEYTGFFAIIAFMTAFELVSDMIVMKRFVFDPTWLAILAFGGTVYLFLRTLKKRTRILHVPGR